MTPTQEGAAEQIEEVVLWSTDVAASTGFVDRDLPSLFEPPASVASVRFVDAREQEPTAGQDAFWKISVFGDDIDALGHSISADGVAVSEAAQFLDIGYLSHLHEPGGNEIELLQRTFRPQRAPLWSDGLDGVDVLGLITLRVARLDAALAFFESGLGMRSLATMEVSSDDRWRFGLRFLAWTGDRQPNASDLGAVENREWLYQRPYTIIELQHGMDLPAPPPNPRPGLAYISASTADLSGVTQRLDLTGFEWTPNSRTEIETRSPDGHLVRIAERPA